MKKILYILIAVILPLLSFGDDNPQAIFEKANAAYTKGKYKDAISGYQVVLNQGYQSAAIYFNMGNANYKNGDVDLALLYYEKAHKLSPGDEDINFNIRFANLKTTDKIDEAPELFLIRWWRAIILSVSAKALSVICILLVLCGSGILILYFFTGSVRIKKASFFTSVALFFLGMISLYLAGRQLSYFEDHKQAIIFSTSVNIKSSPGDKSTILFVLHDGTKVNVLDSKHGWLKIKLANGNIGWLMASDVKEI